MKPLEGLRVIDATEGTSAGLRRWCWPILAPVIKLERDGGDPARAAYARTWLRGKQSLTCSTAQAHQLIVTTADALVVDHRATAPAAAPDLVIGITGPFDGLPNMKVSSRRDSAACWRFAAALRGGRSSAPCRSQRMQRRRASPGVMPRFLRVGAAPVRCSRRLWRMACLPK
jgi:hypothetical protein